MTKHVSPRLRGVLSVRADASDPAVITAELMKAWTEFKSEHTEQITALKKGQEDVVKAEKVDRINEDVGKLQAALDKAMTDIAALKIGGGASTPDGKSGDPEYRAEFESYFRDGEVSAKVKANKIQAAANKGTPGQGGYLAPIEWDRSITDRLIQVSPMRQIASVQAITTAGYTKLYNMRGTGSGWVGETAARPETTTPTLEPITIVPGTIYAMPGATEEILEDAEIDIEAWLTNEVESEFSYQEGLAFVSGNGTNKPNGFLTYVTGGVNADTHPYGAIPQKVAAAAAAITSDELLDLIYDLPQEYTANARWVMNRSTQARIRKLKDGQNNYIWQPSFQAGQPAMLAGFPVTEMAAMPNVAANAYPIAFGDFRRGYQIVDRRGVSVLRDPYSNKPYVMFYMTKRVGGAVVDPDVLRVLKMAGA
jgi:HK97 family phage major capsid protein